MEEADEVGAPAGLPTSLRDPLGLMRRRWSWMAVAFTLGLAATAAFLRLHAPSYLASATVLITSKRIPESFVRSTVTEDSFEHVSAMIGEILSREKLAAVIEKHGLYAEQRKQLPMSDLTTLLRTDIKVELDPGETSTSQSAHLLRISFINTNPKVAADVANDLADLFTSASIQQRSQQSELTTEFLRRELAQAEEALKEQNRKITEFKERYRGELPEEQDSNLRRLELLQQQRQSLAAQIGEANTRIAMMAAGAGGGATPESRLEQLRGRLATELAGGHTEQYPDVIELRREIESLEAETAKQSKDAKEGAAANQATVIQSAQRQVVALESELARTEAELRELQTRIVRTPARQEEESALLEKANVLRDNYTEYLRKVKDAELAESLETAQQGERFSVMDPAVPPTHPKISSGKILAVGGLLSLLLAAGVGVLLELRDPVLGNASQLEAELGVPPLGSVIKIA
ncbi:MAG TPA: hypothetical protein VKM54_19305 [Myxococcota bacterium]|nr:hypothetical protein [Myxococcota bacterium]